MLIWGVAGAARSLAAVDVSLLLLEVEAGAERAAVARQHDRADLGIHVERADRGALFGGHSERPGVELLRTVLADQADGAFA